MIPMSATTTSEPTRLPICIGTQTIGQMKPGRSLMSLNSRSSQSGTVSLATTKIQLAASSTAPPSTATTSPTRTREEMPDRAGASSTGRGG